MYNNYDGSHVGQDKAQYGAIEELYRLWDGANKSKEGRSLPSNNKESRLPLVTAAVAALALIAVVVVLSWPLI